MGLTHSSPIDINNLQSDLNNIGGQLLRRKLYESALTIAANDQAVLPLMNYGGKKFASISIGGQGISEFQHMLQHYARFDEFYMPKEFKKDLADQTMATLDEYDYVIVGMHEMSRRPELNYGLSEARVNFVKELSKRTKVILVLFGTPYSLKYLKIKTRWWWLMKTMKSPRCRCHGPLWRDSRNGKTAGNRQQQIQSRYRLQMGISDTLEIYHARRSRCEKRGAVSY
jgi:hypothetical protein